MCIYVFANFEIKGLCPVFNKNGYFLSLYTAVSPSVPKMEGIYATGGHPFLEDVTFEVMHLVFPYMPGQSYCRRFMSLLCLCDVFRALIK